MNTPFGAWLLQHYHWQLSLYAAVEIAAVSFVGKQLVLLVPTFKEASQLNDAAFDEKMKKAEYAANQKWNRKWGLIDWAVSFGLILPFCLTLEPQPWWRIPRDIVVILMF